MTSQIRVDLHDFKTNFDLKKLIASQNNIPDANLIIRDQPNQIPLKKFAENYQFHFEYSTNTLIKFYFPNKVVPIENCNKISFDDILNRFRCEGFFYSPFFIQKNLQLKSSNFEYQKNGFPFIGAPNGTDVNVCIKDLYLFLQYDDYTFFLSDLEPASNAYALLVSAFGGYCQISVLTDDGYKMEPDDCMSTAQLYKVSVLRTFDFLDLNGSGWKQLRLEFTATALEAKKELLAQAIGGAEDEYEEILPEQVRLFNGANQRIHHNSVRLINAQLPGEPFFFSINLRKKAVQPNSHNHQREEIKDELKSDGKTGIEKEEKIKKQPSTHGSERKKKSAKMFMPKIKEIDDSSASGSTETRCRFEFEGRTEEVELSKKSKLGENCSLVKEAFGIDSKAPIEFFVEKGKSRERLNEDKTDIATIEDETVHVCLAADEDESENKNVDENESENKNVDEGEKIKYNFQINREPDSGEVSLSVEAKVEDMKKVIADRYEIGNVGNVKILFAGKELLSDIVLSDLEIGETKLFVYIRSEEEIFLMTAKALRYEADSSDYTYEEEEEEKKED